MASPYLFTGGPSFSYETIILRNKSHGEIIRVCMEIFTTVLRSKIIQSNSQEKYLNLLPQCIACYLTAYYDEKNPFPGFISELFSFRFTRYRRGSFLGHVWFILHVDIFCSRPELARLKTIISLI